MSLKLKIAAKYAGDCNACGCSTTLFLEILQMLTSDFYEDNAKEYYLGRERSMIIAKYIMEYLFFTNGLVVCEDGYCVKKVIDVGNPIWQVEANRINNILDINQYYLRNVFIIYTIVLKLYNSDTNEVDVAVNNELSSMFVDWADRTELEGTVKINILLDNEALTKYKECRSLAEFVLWSDENNANCEIETYNEDLVNLTPEREADLYNSYKELLVIRKNNRLSFITVIQIKRCSDGKIEFGIIPTSSYPNDEKLYNSIMCNTRKDEESITLVYGKHDLGERFIYNKASNFYRAFRVYKGKLYKLDKADAFERFHQLYQEMANEK